MFILRIVAAWSAGLTWKTLNYYYVAYVLQICIAALCPRPKIRTGVSAVEFVCLDCSCPLHILRVLCLGCYLWSFALPFTARLIEFGSRQTEIYRYRTGDPTAYRTRLSPL